MLWLSVPSGTRDQHYFFFFDRLLSSLQKLLYLVIILILDFPEESDVFDKPGFDMFIVHELAKNIKFFPQKLVSEVDLE